MRAQRLLRDSMAPSLRAASLLLVASALGGCAGDDGSGLVDDTGTTPSMGGSVGMTSGQGGAEPSMSGRGSGTSGAPGDGGRSAGTGGAFAAGGSVGTGGFGGTSGTSSLAGAGGDSMSGGAGGGMGRGGRGPGMAGMGGGGSSGGGAGMDNGSAGMDAGITPGDCTPVNPNATQQAKNLLCYLYGIYGESVLSGQQETSWVANPADDVNWINTQTGKYPAVLGGDYLYPNGTTSRAKAYWDAGGIPMIRYHMGAPPASDTYDNSKGTADIDAVLTSGTSANTSFKSKLDYVAKELATLQSANVAVIWAPFHEVQQGGWFWWAKGTGAQFVSLWKYMFDYLTTTKGINNVLWLWPASGTPNGDYFPGKEYVDLGGPDTYDQGQPFGSLYTKTRGTVGSSLPIPLHETGVIPDPEQMFPTTAPWLLFSVWAGYEKDTSQNSVAAIKATYAHERTLTRDEVPDLK